MGIEYHKTFEIAIPDWQLFFFPIQRKGHPFVFGQPLQVLFIFCLFPLKEGINLLLNLRRRGALDQISCGL